MNSQMMKKMRGGVPIGSLFLIQIVVLPTVLVGIFFRDEIVGIINTNTENMTSILQGVGVVLIGGVLAWLAWTAKDMLRYLRQKARVKIMDSLSRSEPLTLDEIREEVTHLGAFFRVFDHFYFEALDQLLSERLVSVSDGKYQLAAK